MPGSVPSLTMAGSERQQVWKAGHAVAFALTGPGAGAYVLGVLGVGGAARAPVLVLGLVATVVGALVLLAEVKHHRSLLFNVPSRLANSWMSRGVSAMFLFLVAGAGGLLATYLAPSLPALAKSLAILAAVCALVVMVYQGFVLASSCVAFWKTRLTTLGFLVGNVSGGIALANLYFAARGNVGVLPAALRPCLVVFLVAHLIIVLAHLRFASPGVRAYALRLLSSGHLASFFLGGAVVNGVVVPSLLVGASYYFPEGVGAIMIIVSSVLVIVGLVAHRYCLLSAGVPPGIPREVLAEVFSPTGRTTRPGLSGSGSVPGETLPSLGVGLAR